MRCSTLQRKWSYRRGLYFGQLALLEPEFSSNLVLVDWVSYCGTSSHWLTLCADTFMHSYSSLCVFFNSGLSTGFHRPVSHHSSHPCSNITLPSLRLLLYPSPGPSTQHGQITRLKAIWWGHASSQNTSGCLDLCHLELCTLSYPSPLYSLTQEPHLTCLLASILTPSGKAPTCKGRRIEQNPYTMIEPRLFPQALSPSSCLL